MRELIHKYEDELETYYEPLVNGMIEIVQIFYNDNISTGVTIYLNKQAARALYNRLGRSLEEMDESKITGEEGFDGAD